ADPGLYEFLAAELIGLLAANLADAGDGFAAVFEAAALELALRRRGGRDGGAHVVEDAEGAGLAVAVGAGLAATHVRQHFLHHVADQFVGHLHGGPHVLTTETQRHREDKKQRTTASEGLRILFLFPYLLCVSVYLWFKSLSLG